MRLVKIINIKMIKIKQLKIKKMIMLVNKIN